MTEEEKKLDNLLQEKDEVLDEASQLHIKDKVLEMRRNRWLAEIENYTPTSENRLTTRALLEEGQALREEIRTLKGGFDEGLEKISTLTARLHGALANTPVEVEPEAGGIKSTLVWDTVSGILSQYMRDFPQDFTKIVVAAAEEQVPWLMRQYYPRQYEHIGNYHSPKALAALLSLMTVGALNDGPERTPTAFRLILPGLKSMLAKSMPLLFLAPKLLEAIERSDFADDINWTELKLPYECGCFLLPRGGMQHPTDGDVAYIFWNRVVPGNYPGPIPGIASMEITSTAMAVVAYCSGRGVWYDFNLTASHSPVLKLKNVFYTQPGEEEPFLPLNTPVDAPLDPGDAEFLQKLGVVVFGTMLALNAKPQLYEPGKRLKVLKAKDGNKEFWSPNVLGRMYVFKREALGGTHASPRMHWRRGHFKQQVYGRRIDELGYKIDAVKREHKTIWIEPCLVGVKEEENAKN